MMSQYVGPANATTKGRGKFRKDNQIKAPRVSEAVVCVRARLKDSGEEGAVAKESAFFFYNTRRSRTQKAAASNKRVSPTELKLIRGLRVVPPGLLLNCYRLQSQLKWISYLSNSVLSQFCFLGFHTPSPHSLFATLTRIPLDPRHAYDITPDVLHTSMRPHMRFGV